MGRFALEAGLNVVDITRLTENYRNNLDAESYGFGLCFPYVNWDTIMVDVEGADPSVYFSSAWACNDWHARVEQQDTVIGLQGYRHLAWKISLVSGKVKLTNGGLDTIMLHEDIDSRINPRYIPAQYSAFGRTRISIDTKATENIDKASVFMNVLQFDSKVEDRKWFISYPGLGGKSKIINVLLYPHLLMEALPDLYVPGSESDIERGVLISATCLEPEQSMEVIMLIRSGLNKEAVALNKKYKSEVLCDKANKLNGILEKIEWSIPCFTTLPPSDIEETRKEWYGKYYKKPKCSMFLSLLEFLKIHRFGDNQYVRTLPMEMVMYIIVSLLKSSFFY